MSGSPNATAHVEPLLEAYHAGALPPEDAARVERHLRACAACREQADAIAVYQTIRSAPAPTVGPELRQRLYARITAAERADGSAASAASQASQARLRARAASDAGSGARRHGGFARVGGWLSGAAAVLIVALLVGTFWALPHIHQGAKPATHHATLTTACPASKTTADLPANVVLNDLAMTSATDGWAVGEIVDATGQTSQGVILRYSDCHWSQVALDLKDVGLTHISMDSPTDGWASGQWVYGSANYNSQGFILLHYTGGAWSVAPASQRPANHGMVLALSMHTHDDGWLLTNGPDEFTHANGRIAVGISRLWHYQQGAWTQVAPAPIQMLEVIAPDGPDDLWAAGSTFTDPYKDQAWYLAHYHNGAWTQIASPDGLRVMSMSAVSPTDIWANGVHVYGAGYAIAHYDGVAWSLAPNTVSALPTPALTPGAAYAPTDPNNPVLHGGEFDGVATITGDGAGWAWTWQPGLITTPGTEALIGAVYREAGGAWQSLNWPYSDVGYITSWTTLPDGEVWALGSWSKAGTQTPLPGGGSTTSMSVYAYLLHYADGQWSRYVTITHTS